jgi:mannose-1-phosphate guanylyltransferase
MRYAVILAGGAGRRLWPLSRNARPKQLLSLLGGKSLLEMAVDRLNGLFDPQNILVITNDEYAQQVHTALPMLPAQNIIGEPEGRDTATPSPWPPKCWPHATSRPSWPSSLPTT